MEKLKWMTQGNSDADIVNKLIQYFVSKTSGIKNTGHV